MRHIEEARELGVETNITKIDFLKIMERMRSLIGKDIESIRQGLSSSENIDYYHDVAEFVSPYTMKVGSETIKSGMIFLTIGSKTNIPNMKGLEQVGYLTSDSVLQLTKLPESVAIIGGGYIATEFGHFLSSMGSKVTIVGRNPRILPEEEPEVSELAKKELGKHIEMITNCEVIEAQKTPGGLKRLIARDRTSGAAIQVDAEEIMVACGRGPLTDILHPEKGGVKTTKDNPEFPYRRADLGWSVRERDRAFPDANLDSERHQCLHDNSFPSISLVEIGGCQRTASGKIS